MRPDDPKWDDEELIDFGDISEETRGGAFGHNWDGGFGWKFP